MIAIFFIPVTIIYLLAIAVRTFRRATITTTMISQFRELSRLASASNNATDDEVNGGSADVM